MVTLRWNLPLLEFDRSESNSIWRDVYEVRGEVMATVSHYWFERARVLREMVDVRHTPQGTRALGLRAAEMTAALDAFSGGSISGNRGR